MILPEADQAILEAIQDNLPNVPKSSIIIQTGTSPPKRTPAIHLWNRAFTASDSSIGAEGPEVGEVLEEEFDGDGTKTMFSLSTPPLRPIVGVDSPRNRTRREGKDFKVNYSAGTLTLFDPPLRGRKNVLVRYRSARGAGELKGLRLRINYNLDVWTSESAEEDSIVNQVATALVKTRDTLATRGVQVRLTRGRTLTTKDGVPDGLSCTRLECIAEADMRVKILMPRIEKVELHSVENPEVTNH